MPSGSDTTANTVAQPAKEAEVELYLPQRYEDLMPEGMPAPRTPEEVYQMLDQLVAPVHSPNGLPPYMAANLLEGTLLFRRFQAEGMAYQAAMNRTHREQLKRIKARERQQSP